MSKYHLETTKTTVINGIEYSGEIDKVVDIDFLAANYALELRENGRDSDIELIPDSYDFLHEVTDIFPLSEYDIAITQYLSRRGKSHVSPHLEMKHKGTDESVFFAESAVLSDKDYDYIRNILVREFPQYEWLTAEESLCVDMRGLLFDLTTEELLSDDAYGSLVHLLSARWKDIKIKGFVDFRDDAVAPMARGIIEKALKEFGNGGEAAPSVGDKEDSMTLKSMICDAAVKKYGTDQFQRSLARDCAISNATISRIMAEDGIHPDTATLRKIADCLGIDYLLLLRLNGDLTEGEYGRLGR